MGNKITQKSIIQITHRAAQNYRHTLKPSCLICLHMKVKARDFAECYKGSHITDSMVRSLGAMTVTASNCEDFSSMLEEEI